MQEKMNHPLILFKKLLVLSLLVSTTTMVSAQVWTQQTVPNLPATDLWGFSYLGCSSSLSPDGNIALVGAYDRDVGSNSFQGSAYLFSRSGTTWTQQQIIIHNNGAYHDEFGTVVRLSADGKVAVISAAYQQIGFNISQGAVYVFTRASNTDLFVQQQVLLHSNGRRNYNFGYSLEISPDGSMILASSGNYCCYFKRTGNTWIEQQAFTDTDRSAYGLGSGIGLSADGNTVAIGAFVGELVPGVKRGNVFIYTRNNDVWTKQTQLVLNDTVRMENFGIKTAISADGNTVVASATAIKWVGNYTLPYGKIFVFTRTGNTWQQTAAFYASDPVDRDDYGGQLSISADGTTIIVGAQYKKVGTTNYQGKAYIYKRSGNTWTEEASLLAQNGGANERFGSSVSLSANGDVALVGAEDPYTKSKAYIFVRNAGSIPVELVLFEGKSNNNTVYLDWQTASEIRNDHFDIERSSDAISFNNIGTVKAFGKAANYNFVDQEAPNGVNYYRLKQVDTDGKFTYSKVIAVKINKKASKSVIYPTYTEGSLFIKNETSEIKQVSVVNALGHLVLQTQALDRLDLSPFPSGIYFIQVSDTKGTTTEKIIKH
jgi:hypothetical protein